MKAIYVNAKEKTIKSIDVQDAAEVRQLLACQMLQPMPLDDENDLWSDEEGLLRHPKYFFLIDGYEAPIASGAVILGRTPHTNTIRDTNWTLEDAEMSVEFLDQFQAYEMALGYDKRMQKKAEEHGAIFMPIADLIEPIGKKESEL